MDALEGSHLGGNHFIQEWPNYAPEAVEDPWRGIDAEAPERFRVVPFQRGDEKLDKIEIHVFEAKVGHIKNNQNSLLAGRQETARRLHLVDGELFQVDRVN